MYFKIISALVFASMAVFTASAKDTKPTFPGGDKALKQYFIDKLPLRNDVSSIKKLTMMLKIDTAGNVLQALPQVADENLKAATIKAAKDLPRFIPATTNGKATDAWMKVVVPLDGKKTEPKLVYVNDYSTLTEIIIVNDEEFVANEVLNASTQVNTTVVEQPKPFTGKIYRASEVSSQPVFPGGEVALSKFIKENIKCPNGASQSVVGSVLDKAIIAEDGSVAESSVVKGLSPDHNAEALRVVRSLPQFTPAQHNGKPVNCQRVITVNFSAD